jgi:hypothetical protein
VERRMAKIGIAKPKTRDDASALRVRVSREMEI